MMETLAAIVLGAIYCTYVGGSFMLTPRFTLFNNPNLLIQRHCSYIVHVGPMVGLRLTCSTVVLHYIFYLDGYTVTLIHGRQKETVYSDRHVALHLVVKLPSYSSSYVYTETQQRQVHP